VGDEKERIAVLEQRADTVDSQLSTLARALTDVTAKMDRIHTAIMIVAVAALASGNGKAIFELLQGLAGAPH